MSSADPELATYPYSGLFFDWFTAFKNLSVIK